MYRPTNRSLYDIVHVGSWDGIEVKYKLCDFLHSADSDKVVVDRDLMRNFKRLAVLHREMENYILGIEGYEIRIAHCYRSMTTYHRLKAQGKKPSKNSQHFRGLALDLHIYHMGVRIRNREESEHIAKLIWDKFNDDVLQVGFYLWGVHVGIPGDGPIDRELKKVLFRGAT